MSKKVNELTPKVDRYTVTDADGQLSATEYNVILDAVQRHEAQLAVGDFLRFSEQALDDNDKRQARQNIGAVGEGDYASKMSVGFADNINGDGAPVLEKFYFQPSAGVNRNVRDGVARIDSIYGNSVVWNQKLHNGNFLLGTNYWHGINTTLSHNTNGSMRLTNKTGGSQGIMTSEDYYDISLNIKANHKFLLVVDFQRSSNTNSPVSFYLSRRNIGNFDECNITNVSLNNTARQSVHCIITSTDDIKAIYIYPFIEGEVDSYCDVYSCACYDLTQMFGAGTEPTTVEDFYARIPIGIDTTEYNGGVIVNSNPKSIKTTGFNQWDEQWEAGQISFDNGSNAVSSINIRTKNYIPILPNKDYYWNRMGYVRCYDKEKNYIGGLLPTSDNGWSNGGLIKASNFPSGTAYIRFWMPKEYGTTYNHDICINLAWSEYEHLNGTYQPYTPFVRDLSWIKEYFPEGLKRVGDVYDEIRFNSSKQKWEAVYRIGSVDLGSLKWSYGYGMFTGEGTNAAPGLNVLCTRYASGYNDKNIRAHSELDGYIFVYDSSYSDPATFKASVQGVMLYYELAKPNIVDIEDSNINFDYDIYDYGTEQFIPNGGSTEFVADVIYNPNALATLKAVPEMLDTLTLHTTELKNLNTTTAKKDGHYSKMSVGFADNLIGRGEATAEEFTYRASAGMGRSITDDTARVKKIKGNSVVWNQKLHNGNFLLGTNYWHGINTTLSHNTNGSMRLTNKTGGSQGIMTSEDYYDISLNIKANHKFLLVVDFQRSSNTNSPVSFYLSRRNIGNFDECNITNVSLNNTARQSVHCIITSTDDIKAIYIYPFIEGEVDSYCDVYSCACYDLTQMFGAGNEPTTVEDFYARIPSGIDIHAYNEGEIISMNTEAIKTVGFNAWDEQWEVGALSGNDGTLVDNSGAIRSSGFIQVVAGSVYNIQCPTQVILCAYDDKYQYIEWLLWGGNTSQFTIPHNCKYIKFCTYGNIYGNTYNHDICVNLSHTGIENGKYKPYTPFTRELPIIKKYFPEGMRKAGSVADSIEWDSTKQKWVAVQRVGVVDLGDLAWASAGIGDLYQAGILDKRLAASIGAQSNLLCDRYATVKITYASAENKPAYSVMESLSENKRLIYITDVSYTDAATFKAAMQGVMLYYELAEPIVTEIEEENINFDYYVEDFGTEEALSSVPSAPFIADVVYTFNAVDTIRNNYLEIEELKKQMVQIQNTISAMQVAQVKVEE